MDGGDDRARGSYLPAHYTIRLRPLLAYVNKPWRLFYWWMKGANKKYLSFSFYNFSDTSINDTISYEGWNFNRGNYLFTTDTK